MLSTSSRNAWGAAAALALLLLASVPGSWAQTTCQADNCLVSGGPKGTYFHMANDLKRHVAPELSVLESTGSYTNVQRLAVEKGVSFAIVQADVLNYVNLLIRVEPDAARAEQLKRMIAPLQVMLPLYNEELHVLVNRNSKLKYLHEIENARIFMGRAGSGSYITGKQMYELMFGRALGNREVRAASFGKESSGEEIDQALTNLGRLRQADPDPAVDVVMLVGGQPYGQIGNLEKSRQVAENFRFLTIDSNHPKTRMLMERYATGTLSATHYPGITGESKAGVATLAVPAYLVTAAFSDSQRNRFVEELAAGYCRNFQQLAADKDAHAKWKQVLWKPGNPPPKVVPGWRTVPPNVMQAMARCDEPVRAPKSPKPTPRGDKGPCFPNPRNPAECI